MNRVTINGVTVELPADMTFTVNGNMISVKHTVGAIIHEKKEAKTEEVIRDYTPPTTSKTKSPKPRLPANVDQLIIRHLRNNEGKGYMIGISKMLSTHLGRAIDDWGTKQLIKDKMKELVDVGLLIILAQTPMKLYGLAAMQEREQQVPPDEPLTEYVNGN